MWRRIASPELVGRERELNELNAALARANAGSPAVILVVGEAGLGKTRLVKQFISSVEQPVWVGHCLPLGDGQLPYAPVIEVLRAAVEQLGLPAARALAGQLWPKLTRLLPELGDTPPRSRPAENSQAAQWADLMWLLNRLTLEPTVIVIEDLHWADSSTLGLLNLLVRGATGRLLLICTYRDDELPPAHPLRSTLAQWRRAGTDAISLARLDRDQVAGQVRAITHAEPAPAEIDELFRRSGGNPFFVEELLAAGPQAAQLPEGLRDLLLLRVRQLPPSARQAVRVVAVAGHSAGHTLLAEVVAATAQDLTAGLGEAVDSHIMVTLGDTYAFRHVLVGEAVVADMLPGERIALHRRIAEALDRRLAHGTAATIRPVLLAETAHHWLAAGVAERALLSAIEAGLAAEDTFALPEAHGHFQTALRLWEQAPAGHQGACLDIVGLHQHAAETAYLLDDLETALALIQQGLDRADAVADPMRAGLMHERQGRFMLASGKPTAATLLAYQRAVDLVPDEASQERARVLAGFSAMVLGAARHDDAADWARQAVHTARRAGARQEEARGLSTLGCSLVMLGKQDEGVSRLREALTVAIEMQDPVIQMSTYINLSDALHNMGRFADAADEALRGLDTFENDRFQRGLYLCLLGNAMEALFWQGRWDELAARLGDIDQPDDTKTMHLNLWMVAAAYQTAIGMFAEAQSTVDACRNALAGAHLELAGHLHACVAELRLWQGEPQAAWASVQQALDILGENCSHGPLVARLLAGGARACADLAILHSLSDSQALDRLSRRIAQLPTALRLTSLAEAHLSQARAELARLEPDAVSPWESAAKRWKDLSAAYPTAYANWRHAEALLSGGARRQMAERPLAEAFATAQRLGAEPLRREIETIAARARLNLGPPPVGKAQTPYGLTARELDVLVLLARGHTNRQIAKGLFISEKTAGIHVSRILTKMGVPNRGAAAAAAHRLGLAEVLPS